MERGLLSGRLLAASLCFFALAHARIGYAADPTHHFSIPSEDLATALEDFGRQSGEEIIFNRDDTRGKTAHPVSGDYTSNDMLSKLLAGSGLAVRQANAHTFVVESMARPPSTPNDQNQSGPPERPTTSTATGLAEIIVTAQKRGNERLQDVPIPISVLNTDSLAENGQNRLQDYFATVPGLSLLSFGDGLQTLAIRGLITGTFTNPTVGVSIDDVPYGSSTSLGNGSTLYPDIDPSDLARIEVLKGPQGTLYGASSIGGLLRFVTKDPSTEELSGHVQLLGSSVKDGELGYGLRAGVNVPLSDTFAIRVSGFTRSDPGYVDNVLTGQTNVNRGEAEGGRLSALWRPLDTVSLKLSALLQDTKGYAKSSVDSNSVALQPTTGHLQETAIPGDGAYTSKTRLYTAALTAKLGSLDFISTSAYGTTQNLLFEDVTRCCASFFTQPAFPGSGNLQVANDETRKVTQEFQLSSVGGRTLEWLVGAFYTHENTSTDSSEVAFNPATYAPLGTTIDFNLPTTLSEYALFGDFTVHFTDRFDVQFGGRDSEIRQTYSEVDSGLDKVVQYALGVPSPNIDPLQHANGNAFTYLLTPRFKISPDLMVYARFTSGYRVGGNNAFAAVNHIPSQFAPDKTNNYELGVKGELFDHLLSFDASAYYIDWKQIQISVSPGCCAYTANAGSAKSQGLEMSVTAQPAKGLTITGSASLDDAKLTQNIPNPYIEGPAGERLPYSSRFSGNLSANQDVALASGWTGFVGGSLSYVGARLSDFTFPGGPPRLRFPAYADVDLRTGVRHESWTVNLFVNNVTDKRGVIGGGAAFAATQAPPYYGVYIQPRTVGLSLTKTFQ